MQNKQSFIVAALVIIIAIIGLSQLNPGEDETTAMTTSENSRESELTTSEPDRATETTPVTEVKEAEKMSAETMNKEEMMNHEETESMTKEAMAKPKPGTYESYSADKVASSESKNLVLFFHASWCPSCRALDSEITKNLSGLPTDTTIYKLDYDTSTDLKKKYGVTSQHTLVQIDRDGNLIQKWSGGGVAEIVAKLK